VVVAVVAVLMMQVPVDQVVDVITVGYCRVSAVRAVDMVRVMATALVGSTALGIGR
jgi:hypothetical protein